MFPHLRNWKKPREEPHRHKQKCLWCSKAFLSRRKNTKFCSRACGHKVWRKRRANAKSKQEENMRYKPKVTTRITVVLSTWQVPFDQVVVGIYHLMTEKSVLDVINTKAAAWWTDHSTEPFEPCDELGYHHTRWEVGDGEAGFQAMLMKDDYARLHEARYKREYDDKGLMRPGYLINAYVDGHKPGGMTEDELDRYAKQQAVGLKMIEDNLDRLRQAVGPESMAGYLNRVEDNSKH